MAAWKSSTNVFTVKPWTGNFGNEAAGNIQDDIVNTNLVNSQLRLLPFSLFDWLKNSDYEPIVRVLRHMENSAPSSLSGRFVKLWK